MELRQLRYLVGICEAGSLLAASRRLHVAQPALSHHVAALEEELGARLFTRSNRGMAPTDAGRAFLEHARVVLADVERAASSVRLPGAEIRGDVVVGLPTTVALVATLPVLQAARAQHPGVRLKLVESHSGYLREWLEAGRLDLSVLFAAGAGPEPAQRPLLEERLVLVTRPADRPTGREVTLRQAALRPMVLPGRDHGLRRIIDDACARAGVTLDVLAEIDSLPNIKAAVRAGLASTVLSPGAVAEEVEAGQLAVATLARPHITRRVVCASALTRPLTPAGAAMLALIERVIRGLVQSRSWPARWVGADAPA